jgi:hypothetical protein
MPPNEHLQVYDYSLLLQLDENPTSSGDIVSILWALEDGGDG